MYDINKVQLKMLQITSRHAEQQVNIRCHNLAFDNRDVMFHTMKAGSSISPQVYSNGCSVSCVFKKTHHHSVFMPLLNAQEASSASASNFMFTTKRPRQLPVTDISLWLGSGSDEAMAVEFGPVCFSR